MALVDRIRDCWRRARTPARGAERAERAVSRLLWERRFERAALAVLVLLYLAGFHSQQEATDRVKAQQVALEQEGAERRDQSCTIFETKQKSDVDALKRTYDYLSGLSARQLAEPLNKAVLAGLPRTVREAQTDDAPPYCDAPNIGLPEPDPKLPMRPPALP